MRRRHRPSLRHWKQIWTGSAGNLIEWFDWFVYASFAPYFAPAFFPEDDATAQLMNTAGIFAVGFFLRPAGGWLLGRFADRRGRKAALALTVSLMSASAILLALTPPYAVAGYGGAAVLLLARLLQGLSVGGEYAASATYLTEAAPPHRRGFASSFQYVSMTLGQILGLALLLLLQHTLSETALRAWGWRVPFAVGALGAGAVLWLRRSLPETAVYAAEAAAPAGRGTLRALLRHKREALLVVALTMGGTLAYYTYTTYLTKYLAHTAGLPQRTATLVSLVALLVFAALQPLAGALSDRVGRRPLLIAFALGSTFLTVPLLTLLARAKSFWPALGLSLLALLIVTGYTSVNACVKAELFPTGVRALGVALPYALANAAFGGTAEYVALWFKKAGLESGFAWYVAACAAVSLVVYATMRETRELDLGRQTSPAARTPTGATPTAKAT